MLRCCRSYIKPDSKIFNIINENPYIMLFLQHFEIDLKVGDKDFNEISLEYNIPLEILLIIGNIYNGYSPIAQELKVSKESLLYLINFLKKSHEYYKYDKYPEIKELIDKITHKTNDFKINLISQFFNDYFNEVLEHLDYEDNIAFPYIESLLNFDKNNVTQCFSVREYKNHHTDIETKLTDLKNFLLKHLEIKNIDSLKRRLLLSLFELEYDIHMHALIEETILIPLTKELEIYHGK